MNSIKSKFFISYIAIVSVFFSLCMPMSVFADTPSGDDTFELITGQQTGSDDTGDGGTGNPNDFNYYYVGQQFTTTMRIKSGGTNASNIIIGYNTAICDASNLTTGSYFNTWSSQTISGGKVKSTGFNISAPNSSGTGSFGTVRFTANRPTVANYGTGSAAVLDIEEGIIGQTTDSNISLAGADLLDDVEDFNFHVWADTKSPYALSPVPADGATDVAVDSNYQFTLRDSKNGEGDNSGVGTGVNTSTGVGYGVITITENANTVDATAFDSYSCSGVWGTNVCATTLNPSSPSGVGGDQRNWKYDTSYTVEISGFKDRASTTQDQLGDPNGPNTMSAKSYTFQTETDNIAPRVQGESPSRGSSGNAVNTNISVDILDKKTYPGSISGSGINAGTCRINVSSPSVPLHTYQQGDPEVTISAIDYGIRFGINPPSDFLENEIISVSVYDCEDNALTPNTMVTDNYTFATSDATGPQVINKAPGNDSNIVINGTIQFDIVDSGVGVDIANTIVYVNGSYYTRSGGAGSVTTSGTRITFSSSLKFDTGVFGVNYPGDTTGISGTATNYSFVLDPQVDFIAGETIPIIVYTRDLNGNIMERDVYSLSTTGGTGQTCGNSIIEGNEECDDGNIVSGDGCSSSCLSTEICGNRILDTGETCEDGNAVSSDGCSSTCQKETTSGNNQSCTPTSGGGGGAVTTVFTPHVINSTGGDVPDLTQINETSILVTWRTNIPARGRVLYGTQPVTSYGEAPNYGYTASTEEHGEETYHAVIINSLTPQTLYYFRPISLAHGNETKGGEGAMAPKFETQIINQFDPALCPAQIEKVIYKENPPTIVYRDRVVEVSKQVTLQSSLSDRKPVNQVIEVQKEKTETKHIDTKTKTRLKEIIGGKNIKIYGTAEKNSTIRIIIR